MSRTDKTTPYWVVERRGECPRKCGGGYPCKHISMSKNLGIIKDEMIGAERAAVRAAIAQGKEPPTNQHRHRALWDLV